MFITRSRCDDCPLFYVVLGPVLIPNVNLILNFRSSCDYEAFIQFGDVLLQTTNYSHWPMYLGLICTVDASTVPCQDCKGFAFARFKERKSVKAMTLDVASDQKDLQMETCNHEIVFVFFPLFLFSMRLSLRFNSGMRNLHVLHLQRWVRSAGSIEFVGSKNPWEVHSGYQGRREMTGRIC